MEVYKNNEIESNNFIINSPVDDNEFLEYFEDNKEEIYLLEKREPSEFQKIINRYIDLIQFKHDNTPVIPIEINEDKTEEEGEYQYDWQRIHNK